MCKEEVRLFSFRRIGCFATSVFILLAMILVIHDSTYAQKMPAAFTGPKHGNTYVIAHRGAHQFSPENSLSAYRKAIEMGCDFVEIDVRKTKDGRFVSIHNETIDAYFNHKSGKVNDFTLSELRQIPLRKSSDGMEQEYIPTLEQILKLCKGRIGIYLDLKEPDIKNQVQIVKDFGMERQVIWYIPASYIAVISQLKMYCDECLVMPDPGPESNVMKVIKSIRPKLLASDMDHLNALFVVLDSEGLHTTVPAFISDDKRDDYWEDSGIEYMKEQKKWLEQVLELNQEAGFIFLFQHATLYSVKKSRVEEAEKNRAFWGDIFARHGVQVFFSGHDHHYHHALDNGVHFITSAGAGAPLYDIDAVQPETVNYKKIEHFINVEVNKDEAVLHVIDVDGNEFDTIRVKRRKVD